MQSDELDDFMKWWLNTRPFLPPEEGKILYEDDGLTGTVIFRNYPFQVQMFTMKPNVEIPNHVHPNVASYEFYVSGDLTFRNDGVAYNQLCTDCRLLRILADSLHGDTSGLAGGVFLSLQQWLNGVQCSSVGEDWAFEDETEKLRNYARHQAA